MRTITLELPDAVADLLLETPDWSERVRAMIVDAFGTGEKPGTGKANGRKHSKAPQGEDPLAPLWSAIPVKGEAPKDLSREALYADHD